MALSLCAGIAANTGGIDCDVSFGVPSQFAVWGGKLTPANYANAADIQAALESAAHLPNSDTNKMFMFPVIQEVADNTEANTEGTLGLGFKTIIREGKPAYSFKVFAGLQQAKNLRKFNNTTLSVLMFDTNNRIFGTEKAGNFVGAPARIYVSGLKFATGQALEEGVVTITLSFLDSKSLTDNAAFVEVDSTSNMQGLNDVTLTERSAHTVNVYHIDAIVETGEMGSGINIADTYGSELAAAGAWTAKTTAGVVLTITAVSQQATGWDVTIDATEYGALTNGDTFKIGWVAPAVLDATYNVSDLEAIAVTVAK